MQVLLYLSTGGNTQHLFDTCSQHMVTIPHDVLIRDSLTIPEKHGSCSRHMPYVDVSPCPVAPPMPLTAIPVPAAVEEKPVTSNTKSHLSPAHLNVDTRLQITFTGEQIGGREFPTTERQAPLGILAERKQRAPHDIATITAMTKRSLYRRTRAQT